MSFGNEAEATMRNDMVKDRKISLPRTLGWFNIPGTPENGKLVRYSIRFWNMKYSVSSGGSPKIRGAAAIRKQRQRFNNISGWLPNFLELRTIWEFTDRSTGLLGPTLGNYESGLASQALDGGIILDQRFLAEVCKEAEKHLADLQLQIDNAYSPQLRLARNA